jgi:hypothetical protein
MDDHRHPAGHPVRQRAGGVGHEIDARDQVLNPALDLEVPPVCWSQVYRLAGVYPIEIALVKESEDDRGLVNGDSDHGNSDADDFSGLVIYFCNDAVVSGA